MFCPSCSLADKVSFHSCISCERKMCDECVTFSYHCRNIVCLYCDTHTCSEPECNKKLLVNMPVQHLLEFFCGEDCSSMNWERMGQEYNADEIRITPTQITQLPFTNLFSFPQILNVRVYEVDDYTTLAKSIWKKIRSANLPSNDFESYTVRLENMDSYDFICWYQYRYRSKYLTFEDRVFRKSIVNLRALRSIYYGNNTGKVDELVNALKQELLYKNEKFCTEDEYIISK